MEQMKLLAVAQFCIHMAMKMQDQKRVRFVLPVYQTWPHMQAYKYLLKYLIKAPGRSLRKISIKLFFFFFFKGSTLVINLFFLCSRIKYCWVTHACKYLLD